MQEVFGKDLSIKAIVWPFAKNEKEMKELV